MSEGFNKCSQLLAVSIQWALVVSFESIQGCEELCLLLGNVSYCCRWSGGHISLSLDVVIEELEVDTQLDSVAIFFWCDNNWCAPFSRFHHRCNDTLLYQEVNLLLEFVQVCVWYCSGCVDTKWFGIFRQLDLELLTRHSPDLAIEDCGNSLMRSLTVILSTVVLWCEIESPISRVDGCELAS